MITDSEKRKKEAKNSFVKSPEIILEHFKRENLRAVKCGPADDAIGCRVQIPDGAFIVTPEDIENMPRKVRGVFEDIFDELLQEV